MRNGGLFVPMLALLTGACGSALAAGGALTPADVKDVLAKKQPSCQFTFGNIQIAGARRGSVGEISRLGMPPNSMVTPVRVEYSAKCGFTRDYRWNYYFFRDDFGTWSAQSNAMPGNYESDPR